MNNENELYFRILCGHLYDMVEQLRKLPADKWDWTPSQAAPTPRTLAIHAWQWLQCDRQHIAEPDALKHSPVLEPPSDPNALCDALSEETERWKGLILGLSPQQLDEPRRQFNSEEVKNVRWFIGHMIQNTIYKHGQFAELYFALGLDGTEPYSAPFPNPIYEELHAAKAQD